MTPGVAGGSFANKASCIAGCSLLKWSGDDGGDIRLVHAGTMLLPQLQVSNHNVDSKLDGRFETSLPHLSSAMPWL